MLFFRNCFFYIFLINADTDAYYLTILGTGDLFFHLVRVITECQPKAFLLVRVESCFGVLFIISNFSPTVWRPFTAALNVLALPVRGVAEHPAGAFMMLHAAIHAYADVCVRARVRKYVWVCVCVCMCCRSIPNRRHDVMH